MSTVQDTITQWSQAQEQGDVSTLDRLADKDFTLVGPLGFVVPKQQWLAQFNSGALETHSLQQDEILIREYGDTAIAVFAQTQEVSYGGNPNNGAFRVTQFFVKDGDEWHVAGLHYSPITAPPQRP